MKSSDLSLYKTFYKEMLLCRRVEETLQQLYTQGEFGGFCHLYNGQEAISTGVLNAIDKGEDAVISGYRDHVQPICLGMPLNQVFGELLGKSSGCSKGKGGSMHFFSKELKYYGGHGIVGGQIPIAVGLAWAMKIQKSKQVVLCFFGDAAINQGQCHEAMNMAAIWSLPVLFLIENNRYGMGTEIYRMRATKNLLDQAKAYNMESHHINARSVEDVYPQIKKIIQTVRKKPRPILIDLETYRLKGHPVSDPQTYRSKEEVKKERAQDCLKNIEDSILKLDPSFDLETIEDQVTQEIEEALKDAREAPEPHLEEALTDVL
jgi:pyruvate dehydrogenase E1 component alpha subunit